MNIRCILLSLCLAAFVLTASAQTDTAFLNKAITALTIRYQAMPVEKVYLHLDRPHYNPGDTIWFKAYTVIGAKHQLSALSGILYAELINDRDSVLSRYTLKLNNGLAWAEFILPPKKAGIYHLRAYTGWMRNAGPDYFYNQVVRVGFQPKPVVAQAAAAKPDVQFFPEGGELVSGVHSRIAVKAINAAGLGEDIKGTITDNDGDTVAEFKTQHLGMGTFGLIPQLGKTYKAKITCANSTQFAVDLPQARPDGFVLSVNNSSSDSIVVRVATNEKQFSELENTPLYIIAQSGGKIYYTSAARLVSPVLSATLPKSRFPSGILQFTLFSQSGEPLNERIAFVRNNDTLKIRLDTTLQSTTTRQKVSIVLSTREFNDQPVAGSYSVTVTNESRLQVDVPSESTIFNHLLLTSDLKGYIEQPNYYFENSNLQTRADLDILMLTQGYRRFEWQQILQKDALPVTYPPEKGLEIEGILKSVSGKPVPAGKVTLTVPRENFIQDTVTDADGNFKFLDFNLSDTSKMIVRARKKNDGSNVNIYIKQKDYPNNTVYNKDFYEGLFTNITAEQMAEFSRNYENYIKELGQDSLKNGRELQEINVTAKKEPTPNDFNRHGTLLQYDVNMKKLRADFITLKEALMIMIPGLQYKFDRFFYESKLPVHMVIDGLPRNANAIDFYSPDEIESISVISGTLVDPAGTLLITTKRSAGTDTTSNILKEVVIKDKRAEKAGIDNLHGVDNPYTISGTRLEGIGNNLKMDLLATVPFVKYGNNGQIVSADPKFLKSGPSHAPPLYVVIDGLIAGQDDLLRLSPDEIDNVKVLEAAAYKNLYGIVPTGKGNVLDVPILLVTTRAYAGTDTLKNKMLETITVSSKKGPEKNDLQFSSNLNGTGNADQVLLADNLVNCMNLSDCLNGRLAGVIFKSGVPYSIRAQNKLGDAGPMAVIIDGILTAGTSKMMDELNADDVYSIEVLRSGAYLSIYGSEAGNGALVITTKRTSGAGSKYVTSANPAGLILTPLSGYHRARVFYSPKYSHPKTEDEPYDRRSTVYWNPNLISDGNGKISFQYYNNDTKGTYRVVVEGIDINGQIGRCVYKYKVE